MHIASTVTSYYMQASSYALIQIFPVFLSAENVAKHSDDHRHLWNGTSE